MSPSTEKPDGALLDRLGGRFSWRFLPLDAGLLVLALGISSWWFAKEDPGWLNWNPSPWLLLPFFLGGRYGVVAGLSGAMLATLSIRGLEWMNGRTDLADLLPGTPYFVLGLLSAGLVGGLGFELLAGRVKQLQRSSREIIRRNRRIEEDLALYRENEAALQETLLLHGAEFIALTEELKHLFVGSGGRLEEGLLEILFRCFGVTEAAVYRSHKPGGRLHRLASSGDPNRTPLVLPDEKEAAATAALRTGRMVTCKSMWESADPGLREGASSCLAAIPWRDVPGQPVPALLLISRIPFEQISWSNLARIEALFAWVMAHASPAALENAGQSATSGEVLATEPFERRVQLAARLGIELQIPSKLIVFSQAAAPSEVSIPWFLEKLRLLVREVDCIGVIGGMTRPDPGLSAGVLTPLASIEAAETYARRLLKTAGVAESEIAFRVIPVDDRFLKPKTGWKDRKASEEVEAPATAEDSGLGGMPK